MKKWVLSRRDSSEIISKIEATLGKSLALGKSAQVECAEPEEGVVFVRLDGLELIQSKDRFIPYLGSKEALALLPGAVVDEGAIKFLLNGADVMRPGVRRMDDWGDTGRLVVVREEKKDRAIVVASSMVKGTEAAAMSKGPCLKNLHYVGDRYWTLHKAV